MVQTQDEKQLPADLTTTKTALTYRALEEWKDEAVGPLLVVDHLYLKLAMQAKTWNKPCSSS